MLILDEPTSGVDPMARDRFWELLIDLSRNQGVTIFISTHFMNEAERCDRIALMDAGRVLAIGTPAALTKARKCENSKTLSFPISKKQWVRAALRRRGEHRAIGHAADFRRHRADARSRANSWFSPRRMFAYTIREALELLRDPIRLGFALIGTAFLMLVMGSASRPMSTISSFAVLDHDQTPGSRAYLEELRGSRYFFEKAPLKDYGELEKRLQSGDIRPAIEIPPGFGRDIKSGLPASVGAWVDGAMPFRAETIRGYLQAMHQQYLTDAAVRRPRIAGEPGARDNRNTVRLQSGFLQCLRDGAGHDGVPARPDPCDSHGARHRARKGARLDHQPLRDAGDPNRVSDRQAAPLYRRRDDQFHRSVSDGAVRFQPCRSREAFNTPAWGSLLCHGDDRLWHADLLFHKYPDRGVVWDGHSDLSAGNAVFRHVDAGILAHRNSGFHGPAISR